MVTVTVIVVMAVVMAVLVGIVVMVGMVECAFSGGCGCGRGRGHGGGGGEGDHVEGGRASSSQSISAPSRPILLTGWIPNHTSRTEQPRCPRCVGISLRNIYSSAIGTVRN